MKDLLRSIRELPSLILGMNYRNAGFIYPHNPRRYAGLADDKLQTKRRLEAHGLPCPETYAVMQDIGEISRQWEAVQTRDRLALKPARGRGGGGIMVLQKNAAGRWLTGGRTVTREEIFRHCGNIIMGGYSSGSEDAVILEHCIQPHPFFAELYPKGVPDFRIITLQGRPLQAMLRLPTDRSDGKANLHQHGLGVGIDAESGRLKHGFDGRRYHDCHPDTGSRLTGRRVPKWEQVVRLARDTAAAFPLDYLGIDIVLDRECGPLVLEINIRPGLAVQLVNRRGLLSILNQQNEEPKAS